MSTFHSELCNPASLSSVCQECSREVTARVSGLNQIHKASIVPPGCDPNDCRLHWPCSCTTGRVCLEARVLQVVIPGIIIYHIGDAHTCQEVSIRLSHNKLSRSLWPHILSSFGSCVLELIRALEHFVLLPFPKQNITTRFESATKCQTQSAH